MELKLENNLPHQLMPVEGVAAVVEDSIQEAPKASNQNPLLKYQLSGAALMAVREKANILDKATKQRVTHYMLTDKINSLPHHRLLDIKMETGTGKTYAAACAVRMAVLDGTSAKLVTTSRLLDDIRSEYDGGERGALRRAELYRLLALDDLGAERPTEWAIETLTLLIDTRVAEGLPTIVTSNYRIGQIRDLWGGMAGKRVASRLAGACRPIEVKGQDRRLG